MMLFEFLRRRWVLHLLFALSVNYLMGFVLLILGSFLVVHFPQGSFTVKVEDGPLQKKNYLYILPPTTPRNFVFTSQFEVSQTTEFKFDSQTQSERKPCLISTLFLASGNIPYILVNSSNHLCGWLFNFS